MWRANATVVHPRHVDSNSRRTIRLHLIDMPPSSRIPPLLQPYTRLPKDESILLVTSTLGASANWLIIQFLCESLSNSIIKNTQDEEALHEDTENISAILVSWMRDWDFWKSEARKGGGLDLERLKRDKRLAFVDGLSKLFLPEDPDGRQKTTHAPNAIHPRTQQISGAPPGRIPQTMLSVRGPPERNPVKPPTTTLISNASSPTPTSALEASTGHFYVASADLQQLESIVEKATRYIQPSTPQRKTLLILDTPSLLLASNPSIEPSAFSATLLRLHSLTSHVLVHMPADDALISLSAPPQPLEIDAHNFLVNTAHMSSRILSCRVLDTGVAKDVSGVLQVTENTVGLNLGLQRDGAEDEDTKKGREMLYLIKGDGSVKVFERGAGGDT
jgi:elongator complex protein 6